MKRLPFIALAWLGGLCAQAQAISEADAAILDQIQAANATCTSIAAHFTQDKFMPIFEESIRSEGIYHYSKPDKLSMAYTDPAGDLMLINGDDFVMIAAGRRQVTTAKNAKMRDMRTILSACMEGDMRRMPATEITCKETASQYVVTASLSAGKDNKSNITRVVAHYDKADGSIATLYTEEADGTSNTYTLTGKRLNETIDETIFDM